MISAPKKVGFYETEDREVTFYEQEDDEGIFVYASIYIKGDTVEIFDPLGSVGKERK